MQAIITKYLPATNTRGSRIKASCERGSVTISYPYELAMGEEVHRHGAKCLLAKFNAEDKAKYGGECGWNRPFVSGGLPDGSWAHVFVVPTESGVACE